MLIKISSERTGLKETFVFLLKKNKTKTNKKTGFTREAQGLCERRSGRHESVANFCSLGTMGVVIAKMLVYIGEIILMSESHKCYV